MKALAISVISALFIATLHAEPRTFYLNVPADMAGHAFGLYQYDPNDPNSTFSSAYFVPSYWDVSTGTLSLSAVVEDENRSVFVNNYTIGGEISADGVWTSGSISATSFDFTSGGYNVFTFSNDAAYQSNVYGLLFDTTASNGGIWAFPATGQTGEVSLPIPDAGNPTNTGIFNLWFDTGISRNSYYGSATLVDLTRWMYLDGAGTWRWLGSYQVPTMEVIIDVGVDSEGQSFTLHTQGGSAQALVAAFDGGISGQVGMFEEFWVTRNADGALSPRATAMTGIPTQGWSSSFAVQPPNWVQTPFFIGQEIAGHPIKAVHPDGREQWLEPDPAIPWPDNVSTTIGNVTHSYQIFHFRATVDSSQQWTLVDATTNVTLGHRTTVTDGLSNWLPPNPTGQVSVAIPASRTGSDIVLVDSTGIETSWVSGTQTGMWFYVFFGSTGVEYQFKQGTINKVGTAPFRVVDKGTWPNREQAWNGVSSLDLTTWSLTEIISLTLPASRWTHDLWIVSAGHAEKITPISMQGLWAFSGSGETFDPVASFAPFNTFIATGVSYGGSWKVIDMTTSEIAPNNSTSPTDLGGWATGTDTLDSDHDGLYDWYEFLVGTKPDVADTDGDGVNDGAELAAGTNPRAQTLNVAAASSLQIFTPLE